METVSNALQEYIREIIKYPILEKEEEYELAGRAANGDIEARNELVKANLRLVISLAKHYNGCGLNFQDLVQEGNIGLIKATERFDREKGFRFSTYAVWWVKQAMTRALAEQGRSIRVPAHIIESMSHIKTATRQLTIDLGREPTDQEVAMALNMPVEQVKNIRSYMEEVISLDTPVGDEDDGSTIGAMIEDSAFLSPEISSLTEDNISQINAILTTLSDREAEILRYRFGFKDGNTHSLEEIGTLFDLTKERIRQIEAKALRKLRHPSRAAALKECLG